jgi:hypothetical protein
VMMRIKTEAAVLFIGRGVGPSNQRFHLHFLRTTRMRLPYGIRKYNLLNHNFAPSKLLRFECLEFTFFFFLTQGVTFVYIFANGRMIQLV